MRFFLLSKAIERFQMGLHLDKNASEVFKNHLERYIGKFIKENGETKIENQAEFEKK